MFDNARFEIPDQDPAEEVVDCADTLPADEDMQPPEVSEDPATIQESLREDSAMTVAVGEVYTDEAYMDQPHPSPATSQPITMVSYTTDSDAAPGPTGPVDEAPPVKQSEDGAAGSMMSASKPVEELLTPDMLTGDAGANSEAIGADESGAMSDTDKSSDTLPSEAKLPEAYDDTPTSSSRSEGQTIDDEVRQIFTEVKPLFVKEMADRVLDAVRSDVIGVYDGKTVGDLVAAKAASGAAPEEIRTFAERAIEQWNLRGGQEAMVWASVCATGDETALQKARELAGIEVDEDGALQRVQKENPPTTSEVLKIAQLGATTGDAETMALARKTAVQCTAEDMGVVCIQLYRAGDDESLDAAVQKINETHSSSQVDTALHQRALLRNAAGAAVERHDIPGVLKVQEAMLEDLGRAEFDAKLYGMGHEESRERAYATMELYGELVPERVRVIDRELAKAGDPEAIMRARQRVKDGYGNLSAVDSIARDEVLDDLCALHIAGDPESDTRIRTLLQNNEHLAITVTRKLNEGGAHAFAASIIEEIPPEKLSIGQSRALREYRHKAQPADLVVLNDLLDEVIERQRDLPMAARAIRAFAEQ